MRIVELKKESWPPRKLIYRYRTGSHYAFGLRQSKRGWTVDLTLRELPQEVKKGFERELFAPQVEEPRAFAAETGGREVGWMQVGYHSWNKRARVWELLVLEEFRGQGIGKALMRKAIDVSRELGARMLVLETQSCNVKAIRFYLSQGFKLIGFDSAAYTNEDVAKGMVRMELGLQLV